LEKKKKRAGAGPLTRVSAELELPRSAQVPSEMLRVILEMRTCAVREGGHCDDGFKFNQKRARRRKINIIFIMTLKNFLVTTPKKVVQLKVTWPVVSRPSSLSEMVAITAFQLMQYITR
jgi:hypothetical protein